MQNSQRRTITALNLNQKANYHNIVARAEKWLQNALHQGKLALKKIGLKLHQQQKQTSLQQTVASGENWKQNNHV